LIDRRGRRRASIRTGGGGGGRAKRRWLRAYTLYTYMHGRWRRENSINSSLKGFSGWGEGNNEYTMWVRVCVCRCWCLRGIMCVCVCVGIKSLRGICCLCRCGGGDGSPPSGGPRPRILYIACARERVSKWRRWCSARAF